MSTARPDRSGFGRGARSLAAVLAFAAPAAAQELGAQELGASESRGIPPALKLRGHAIAARDQIYNGKHALSGLDVTAAGYRPDLAALGPRTGAEVLDPDELRARALALYGDAAPAPSEHEAASKPEPDLMTPPPDPAARPAPFTIPVALRACGCFLAILAGVILLRRRREQKQSPSDAS